MKTFEDLKVGDYVYRVTISFFDMFWCVDPILQIDKKDDGKLIICEDSEREEGKLELELSQKDLKENSITLRCENADFPVIFFSTYEAFFAYLVRMNTSFSTSIEETYDIKSDK